MAFGLDQVVFAASQIGKNRLKEPIRSAVDLGEVLLRRAGLGGSEFDPPNPPGARNVLEAALGRPDPLMNFRWYADLPVLPDGTSLPWSYIEECSLPLVQFDSVSNYRAGKTYHYAGHYNIGNLTLKLYEDSYGKATAYLEAWRAGILETSTGIYQFPSIYKRPITITVLDVANLTVMFFTYTGCWITSSSPIPLSSDSSARVIIDAEFMVDDLNVVVGKFRDDQIPSVVANVKSLDDVKYLPNSLPASFAAVGYLTGGVRSALSSVGIS